MTAALLMTAACSEQTQSDDFWRALQISADEVEGYSSLREMAGAADVVVRGKFTSVELSRTVRGDAPGDVVGYLAAFLAVEEVLAGNATEAVIRVEFILPTGGRSVDEAVADLTKQPPEGEVIAFLRQKNEPLPQATYRVVNSTGLWTETKRAELDFPLRPEHEPELGSEYQRELSNVDSLDELAEAITTW